MYKKELKRIFDVACSVCGSDEQNAKVRRKYDDAQEAIFAASHDDVLAKTVAPSAVTAPSFSPSVSSSATTTATTPPKMDRPSMDRQTSSVGDGKPRKLSGKNKKERQVHEQCTRTINTATNARLLMTPVEFCDPRKNLARLYMNGEMPEIEHLMVPKQADAKISGGSKALAARVGKGANTLRKSATAMVVPAPLPAPPPMQLPFPVRDDEDEDEEEEPEERGVDVSKTPSKKPKEVPALRRFESVESPLLSPVHPPIVSPSAAVAVAAPPSPGGELNSPDAFSQLSARKARTRGMLALRRPRTNSLVEMYEEGYEARLETMLLALKSKSGARDQHIVSELLATEEDYLHDLGVTLSIFGKMLRPVISEEDYKVVFSNLDHIHSVHILLLADLKV